MQLNNINIYPKYLHTLTELTPRHTFITFKIMLDWWQTV